MCSPRRLVSFDSDPETRTICSSVHGDKIKENGRGSGEGGEGGGSESGGGGRREDDKVMLNDHYSLDNEPLDIVDDSHGPSTISPRKELILHSPGASVDKLEGK